MKLDRSRWPHWVLRVLAMLALAAPAFAQSNDPFLSVAPAAKPAPSRAAPPPAAKPPAPAVSTQVVTPPPAAPVPAAKPPPPVAANFVEHGYHCPIAGMHVVREAGGKTYSWSYRGADPGNADACQMTNAGDSTGSYWFGLYNTTSANAAEAAVAFRKVLNGPTGTEAEFRMIVADGTNYIWQLRNEASETMELAGKSRPVVRITRTQMGLGANHFHGTWTDWYDVETGIVVRQSYLHLSGNAPPGQDWSVTSIGGP